MTKAYMGHNMMKRLLIIICLSFSAFANAQTYRTLLTKSGKLTTDYTTADTYILYQKVADSAWLVKQFTMHDILLTSGTYKDEALKIPHGKFYYYDVVAFTHVENNHMVYDTLVKPKSVGFYLNGVKNGVWLNYYPDGKKAYAVTFENGKLNGLFESYYDMDSSPVNLSGYCVNNLREGNWCKLRADSTVDTYFTYESGIVVKSKPYKNSGATGPSADYDFVKYLTDCSKSAGNNINGVLEIEFMVDKNGRLTDPEIVKNVDIDPEVNQAITQAILKAKKWKPAIDDKKERVAQKQQVTLFFDSPKSITNKHLVVDPLFN